MRAFLSTTDIVLPERSRVIDSVDAIGGCGVTPDGRLRVDGRDDDWTGTPTFIAATGHYDAGEYIWTDYPFDDGGDGHFQYPGEGTAVIPQDGRAGTVDENMQRYGANAADVVELRVAADAHYLYVLARLNFLNATDSTVIGLGFDLDRDAATGLHEWPRAAHILTEAHGFEVFLTAYGDCAWLTTPQGELRLDDVGGAIRARTRDNILEVALPRSLLAESRQFDLVGGTGLWDASAAAWMPVAVSQSGGANNAATPRGKSFPTAPEVFQLLFRDDEPSVNACGGLTTVDANCEGQSVRTFQTRNQIATLRGGSSGHYAVTLDLDRLAPGAPGDPAILRRGGETYFNRVYRSRIDSEGIIGSGNAAVFMSRYQPYMLYVPECYEQGCAQWPDARRAPLVLALHGGNESHLSISPRPSIPEGGSALYGSEAFFAAFDRKSAPLIATVLGRGTLAPSWRGYGEADVLEVLDAVRRSYGTDRERQMIVGASQGGYGGFRMAGLYPDLWNVSFIACPVANEASSNNEEGQVDPSMVPFVIDPLIPAMINLPYRQASGTADPLAPITVDRRLRDAALNAGLDVRYTEYPTGSHCFDAGQAAYPYTNAEAPGAAIALRTPRIGATATVRLRVDPRQYPPGTAFNGLFDVRDAGIRYGSAYWVSGLRLRAAAEQLALSGAAPGGSDESTIGRLDATSHALPGWELGTADCGNGASIGVGGTGGTGGGNPDSDPLLPTAELYQCQAQLRSGERQALLELDARNLDTAAVDLSGAGLSGQAFSLRAIGDGDLTLRFPQTALHSARGACVDAVNADTLYLRLSSTVCEVVVDASPQ